MSFLQARQEAIFRIQSADCTAVDQSSTKAKYASYAITAARVDFLVSRGKVHYLAESNILPVLSPLLRVGEGGSIDQLFLYAAERPHNIFLTRHDAGQKLGGRSVRQIIGAPRIAQVQVVVV
jgi:hypothetical protein